VRFPIAVFTDALADMPLGSALDWCSERDLAGVELGVGGYSPAPHISSAQLIASASSRRELQDSLGRAGVELVALNASGNPLHPDDSIAGEHGRALREAVALAQQLGVDRVVAMSGCPGGPGRNGTGSRPVFAGGAWLPDMEDLWQPQFEQFIAPFWSEFSRWAKDAAPDVLICLELHPGTSVYNAQSFAALREVTDDNIAVNLDPSHFWWQGIDPIATIKWLGDAIGFVHGKDTKLHAERIALHGVLDFRWPSTSDVMPWHFCAVGRGRPVAEWAALLAALADVGYRGPISVEHEDPDLDPETGITASIAGLISAHDALKGAMPTPSNSPAEPQTTAYTEPRSA
jgi:sugar phosphate isomerase/epimerase